MPYKLSSKSLNLLSGVHPDLVKVVKRAIEISPVDFKVTEGLRTVARQREMVAKGLSQTMNSRHLDGHAVDIVPLVDTNKDGVVSSDEMYAWPAYFILAKAMKQAAKEVGVPVEWGGDWKKFKDGPHWQLPFKQYPKGGMKSFAVTAVAGAFTPEVTKAAPITNETETQAATKGLATAGSGAVLGGGLALEPISKGIDALLSQQGELTSGDLVKVGLAAIIIVGSVWLAWRKLR